MNQDYQAKHQTLLLAGFLILRLSLVTSVIGGMKLFLITLSTSLITAVMAYIFSRARSTDIVAKSGPVSFGVFMALLTFLTDSCIGCGAAVLVSTVGATFSAASYAELNKTNYK